MQLVTLTTLSEWARKKNTPRPVKIKLKNQSDQDRILKAAKNLKGRKYTLALYDPVRTSGTQEVSHGTQKEERRGKFGRSVDHQKRKSDKCFTDRLQGGRGHIPRSKRGRSPPKKLEKKNEAWFKHPKLDERKSTILGWQCERSKISWYQGDTYLKSWMTKFFEDFFSVR